MTTKFSLKDVFPNSNPLSFITQKARVAFHIMKLALFVTVDDGGSYVTFHYQDVRIKIKK